MKPHPAAAVFPALEGDELEAMIQDIAQNGQLEPIVEHDGMILDGNSRFAACRALSIEPKIKPWDGEGEPRLRSLSAETSGAGILNRASALG